MREKQPQWVVFDLGGVLVEIGGVVDTIRAARPESNEDPWEAWLRSPAVEAWETGRTSNEEFADDLIKELGLLRSREEFLADCSTWVVGTFPETLPMLAALRGQVKLACLSNTNGLHWPIIQRDLRIHEQLDRSFLSYQMGLAKPDLAIFKEVAERLDSPPEALLFIDDNRLNVAAARDAGLQAEQAFGGAAVRDILRARGFSV